MKVFQCFLLLTALFVSNPAFNQEMEYVKLSDEELPTKIEIKFYEFFKKAKNVKWYVADEDSQKLYKGEFVLDGQLAALVFNKNANPVRQIISSRKNDIPEEITKYFEDLNKDYRLFKLSRISELDEQNSEETYSFYKLMVKDGDRELAFQFENDHELFRGKQYFRDVNYLR